MSWFIKQKTEYEVRISDWRSDVCSSDLHVVELQAHGSPVALELLVRAACAAGARPARAGEFSERAFLNGRLDLEQAEAIADLIEASTAEAARAAQRSLRTEEHTSELQLPMRRSYSVCCLKKKNHTPH